jgi:hypothetical protein
MWILAGLAAATASARDARSDEHEDHLISNRLVPAIDDSRLNNLIRSKRWLTDNDEAARHVRLMCVG